MRQTLIALCALICIGLLVFTSGCDEILGKLPWVSQDPYKEADKVIDTAIYEINTGQKNWQDALQDAQDKLTKDAQSTIRSEINNLLQGAIASGGAEMRCNADFIRTRVVQDLARMQARIRGETVEPLKPWVCKAVPNSIDMALRPDQRPSVTLYGFDFPLNTPPRPQVIHYQGTVGNDASSALSLSSPYEMVLDLGLMGATLSTQSTRLSVLWNGSLLSEVSVHQPPLPACKETIDYIPSQTLTLIPSKVCYGCNADNDFIGHGGGGPQIQSKVQVKNYGDRVDIHLEMSAWESPKGDGTQVAGIIDPTVYTPPADYSVQSVQGVTWTTYNYLDTTTTPEIFSGSGPVYSYTFVGNTPGDDVGLTMMKVTLRQINVVIKQYKNCI